MLVNWDAILQVHTKAAKGLPPDLEELPDPLRPAVGPGIGERIESLPLEVGVRSFEGSLEITAIHRLYGLPDSFHVLLRQRPRSISLWLEPRDASSRAKLPNPA